MPKEANQTTDAGLDPVFDPDSFLNGGKPWMVFTEDQGTVTISKRPNEGEYQISYQDPKPNGTDRRAPQNLKYNQTMRTLATDENEPAVVRSISFWERPDGTHAVFASYHCVGPCPAEGGWPIESGGGKGTWGADDG